jgi:hypothetical protein
VLRYADFHVMLASLACAALIIELSRVAVVRSLNVGWSKP